MILVFNDCGVSCSNFQKTAEKTLPSHLPCDVPNDSKNSWVDFNDLTTDLLNSFYSASSPGHCSSLTVSSSLSKVTPLFFQDRTCRYHAWLGGVWNGDVWNSPSWTEMRSFDRIYLAFLSKSFSKRFRLCSEGEMTQEEESVAFKCCTISELLRHAPVQDIKFTNPSSTFKELEFFRSGELCQSTLVRVRVEKNQCTQCIRTHVSWSPEDR